MCSKNKGADQLCTADLRLCFCISKLLCGFCAAGHMIIVSFTFAKSLRQG